MAGGKGAVAASKLEVRHSGAYEIPPMSSSNFDKQQLFSRATGEGKRSVNTKPQRPFAGKSMLRETQEPPATVRTPIQLPLHF